MLEKQWFIAFISKLKYDARGWFSLVLIMFSCGLVHTKMGVCLQCMEKIIPITGISGSLHVGNAEQMLLKLTAEM